MNEGSLFKKISEDSEGRLNQKQQSQEAVVEDVRKEIEDLRSQKEKIEFLEEKLKSVELDLTSAHQEYKKDLEALLPAFENENQKTVLIENNITNIKGLQEAYSGTDEVAAFSNSENSVSEKIANIRSFKKEISEFLQDDKYDKESLQNLSNKLRNMRYSLDREIFALSADTPEGRAEWPVSYPTGLYHVEGKNELIIKEQDFEIRALYHGLGDLIDAGYKESIRELNDPDEALGDNYIEGRHLFYRSTISVNDNKVIFNYGGGYSSVTYELSRNDSGVWSISRKDEYKALSPDKFLKIFNDKLRSIDTGAKSLITKLK